MRILESYLVSLSESISGKYQLVVEQIDVQEKVFKELLSVVSMLLTSLKSGKRREDYCGVISSLIRVILFA